jgi:protein ImuA
MHGGGEMESITTTGSAEETVRALRERLRRLEVESAYRQLEDSAPLSTGCPALDRLLPDGGWRRGTLVEWLADGRGSAAGTLAMITAREVAREGGAVVVMDNRGDFYPPAVSLLGIDLDSLIVIRAGTEKDRLWALDQALRCEGVAAVWAPQDKLDSHNFRRLQLAAENSGALGLLLRDKRVRGLPAWSHVQLLVEPRGQGMECRGERLEVRGQGSGGRRQGAGIRRQGSGVRGQGSGVRSWGSESRRWLAEPRGEDGAGSDRRVRVELIRSRCGKSGGCVELQIDEVTAAIREAHRTDESHLVHPPAQLARAAHRRRSAGA